MIAFKRLLYLIIAAQCKRCYVLLVILKLQYRTDKSGKKSRDSERTLIVVHDACMMYVSSQIFSLDNILPINSPKHQATKSNEKKEILIFNITDNKYIIMFNKSLKSVSE